MDVAKKLCLLLDDAARLASAFDTLNVYCPFETGAEFAAELHSLSKRIAHKDWSAIMPLTTIFAPTGSWDDGIGKEGMELANAILSVVDDLDYHAEF